MGHTCAMEQFWWERTVCGIDFLLLPFGSQGLNSGSQAPFTTGSLSTEPSHWPKMLSAWCLSVCLSYFFMCGVFVLRQCFSKEPWMSWNLEICLVLSSQVWIKGKSLHEQSLSTWVFFLFAFKFNFICIHVCLCLSACVFIVPDAYRHQKRT